MTPVIRYAVMRGTKYVSHRRFNLRNGAHTSWTDPAHARVWARRADAAKVAEAEGGRVVAVHLVFGDPKDYILGVPSTE